MLEQTKEEIVARYLKGEAGRKLYREFGIGHSVFSRIITESGIEVRNLSEAQTLYQSNNTGKKRHTESTRAKLSEIRKKYLAENPDKHVWKRHDKFKSLPCEKFKTVLQEESILYVAEYSDFGDRHYSIDIAFPEYKIGIEINGNQHYNSDGSLKEYYQKRNSYIQCCGWNLVELHYSLCFDRNRVLSIVNNILSTKPLFEFDYREYLLTKIKKSSSDKRYYRVPCSCGEMKDAKALKCKKCFDMTRKRKVERPDLKTLADEISKLGYSGTAKKYGVSDTAIRKWCKDY